MHTRRVFVCTFISMVGLALVLSESVGCDRRLRASSYRHVSAAVGGSTIRAAVDACARGMLERMVARMSCAALLRRRHCTAPKDLADAHLAFPNGSSRIT